MYKFGKDNFKEELLNIFHSDQIKIDELMLKHTSFKVGGNADFYITASDIEQIQKLIDLSEIHDVPIFIIGNGTNVIVKDEGIRGVVLRFISEKYEINQIGSDYIISVDSGMLNGKLGQILLNEELSGFEFAASIPGTIGGAIFMNAGAFENEIKNIISDVTFLDLNDKKIYTYVGSDCKFEYRKSIFESMNCLILNTKLLLKKDIKENIENRMNEYREKRIQSQPIDKPNAGSTFKRGDDFITAKLIDEAGLKGYKIGGAEVSTKHAGFIVNNGDATAQDIIDLIEYIKKVIYEKYNKRIDAEVRILG